MRGDNSLYSYDSRDPRMGLINPNRVVGEVVVLGDDGALG